MLLYERALIQGFFSLAEREAYRHTSSGSWFIQVLADVLRHHAVTEAPNGERRADKELMWMLQRVCHIIAHEFDNSPGQPPIKQMPQIMYTLRNELYFEPKTPRKQPTQPSPELTSSSDRVHCQPSDTFDSDTF